MEKEITELAEKAQLENHAVAAVLFSLLASIKMGNEIDFSNFVIEKWAKPESDRLRGQINN